MSLCDALVAQASAGVAPALRAVDCLANESTAAAFGRLFGSNGALVPALSIILTLYIAFFAITLLTGRSRIGISALTPRMLTLGFVLTFATSWVAYQGVVWNLAIGAPDQIATVLMGARGSATQIFADRIDMVFAAIAQVGTAAQDAQASGGGPPQVAQGSFTPENLMWLAAIILLLGTVGVLVAARIALAVLLAVGPVFVVFGLFSGTRGLCAGWLRGVVMTALSPLFVVVGGGLMLELLVPVVASLSIGEGVDGRASLALFLIASVHVALIGMILKVTGAMVSGWSVFGLATEKREPVGRAASDAGPVTVGVQQNFNSATSRSTIASGSMANFSLHTAGTHTSSSVHTHNNRSLMRQMAGAIPAIPPVVSARARGVGNLHLTGRDAIGIVVSARARGVGSRFRTPLRPDREMFR
jgi:type IV secretion system protein VirB6